MRNWWRSSKFIDLALFDKVEGLPYVMLMEKLLLSISLLRFSCKTMVALSTNTEKGTLLYRKINRRVTWVKAWANSTEITVTDHSWRRQDLQTAMKLCICDQATTLKTSQRTSSTSVNRIRSNIKTNFSSRWTKSRCGKKMKRCGKCKKRCKKNKRSEINWSNWIQYIGMRRWARKIKMDASKMIIPNLSQEQVMLATMIKEQLIQVSEK